MSKKLLKMHNRTTIDYDIFGNNEQFLISRDPKYLFKFECEEENYVMTLQDEVNMVTTIIFFPLLLILVGGMGGSSTHSGEQKKGNFGMLGLDIRYTGYNILKKFERSIGFKIRDNAELTVFPREGHDFLTYRITENDEEVPLYMLHNEKMFKRIKSDEMMEYFGGLTVIMLTSISFIALSFYYPILLFATLFMIYAGVENILCIYHTNKRFSFFYNWMIQHGEIEMTDQNIQYLIDLIDQCEKTNKYERM